MSGRMDSTLKCSEKGEVRREGGSRRVWRRSRLSRNRKEGRRKGADSLFAASSSSRSLSTRAPYV
jgi:hypothetical protein